VAELLPDLKVGDVVQVEGVVRKTEPSSSLQLMLWLGTENKARKVKGAGDE
jgi:hypothetical protein